MTHSQDNNSDACAAAVGLPLTVRVDGDHARQIHEQLDIEVGEVIGANFFTVTPEA